MRVRMKVQISGTRNGESWPDQGGVVDLPEDEAKQLIKGGLAEDPSDDQGEEKAVAPDAPENAAGRRKQPLTTKAATEK